LINQIEIKSLTRFKFRDKNTNNKLKKRFFFYQNCISVNLLLEYIVIWSVRLKVKPFINKISKCFVLNGDIHLHFAGVTWFGRSVVVLMISICMVVRYIFNYPNCKNNHPLFDTTCPIFLKYIIINAIMAYCNINQFKTKKIMKSRDTNSLDQVDKFFKSSTFYASVISWRLHDFLISKTTNKIIY